MRRGAWGYRVWLSLSRRTGGTRSLNMHSPVPCPCAVCSLALPASRVSRRSPANPNGFLGETLLIRVALSRCVALDPCARTSHVRGVRVPSRAALAARGCSWLASLPRYGTGAHVIIPIQVSDSTGFGTGGTSSVATVLSGDDGCFDENTEVSPDFIFHTDPDGVVPTCTTQRLWWNSTQVQGYATHIPYVPVSMPHVKHV